MDSRSSVVVNDTHYTEGMQEALCRMTGEDLDEFLNVYKFITNMDPRVDQTLGKVSVDQLLSGELLNQERFDEMYKYTADEGTEPVPSAEDYTLFDVYDHIEGWKNRIGPTVNTIEDLARESKSIARTTTAAEDVLKTKWSASSVSLEQTMKNEDVIANSSRYLSNIDKYIKTGERHIHDLTTIFHQPASTVDDNPNEAYLHSDECNRRIPDEHEDVKTVITLSATHEKNPGTLLTPSSAYLEIRPKSVMDENDIEVKTYFIE